MGFPQFGKQLSDESIKIVSSGDSMPFTSLMQQLQEEITSKDHLLKVKEETILDGAAKLKNYEFDLYEIRKRLSSVGKERDRNSDTVSAIWLLR